MTEIVLTTAAGITLLVGCAIFFTWNEEHSKRKARQRYERKFHFIDKYIAEMDTAAEEQLEKIRKERMVVFKKEKRPAEGKSVHGLPGGNGCLGDVR